MAGLSPMAVAAMGAATGFVVGFAVRRARLCTMAAIETALVGRDWRRLKVFGVAFAIALLGTQVLVAAGLLDDTQSTYVPQRIAIASVALGSLLFGLGMALVGTCAFGSLVRTGGGDMRGLVTILVFAAVAYATLRGVLSGIRIGVLEPLSLPVPRGEPGSLAGLVGLAESAAFRVGVAAAVALALVAMALRDRRLRKSPRLVTASVVLGMGVLAGWIVTGVLADEFAQVRMQSLTFVAPVARGVYAALLGTGEWLDFGVLSVPGVVAGAALAALVADEFRWEAFDDPREMRRHIAGAALMGFGGVLAGGCTIGQGLTAGSLLALSWPVAMAGMMLGARLGLLLLVEGSLREIVASRLSGFRVRGNSAAE